MKSHPEGIPTANEAAAKPAPPSSATASSIAHSPPSNSAKNAAVAIAAAHCIAASVALAST